ncbi:hypothetical protein L9F63_009706, partial [Diploptera punctata]
MNESQSSMNRFVDQLLEILQEFVHDIHVRVPDLYSLQKFECICDMRSIKIYFTSIQDPV